jgi:pimeloyl-ACP methyl ester carboxylesterase
MAPGFVSHLDLWWTRPETTAFARRLASFSRLILFDKRGTGLSDPVPGPSKLEDRMEDLHAVLDAAGSEQPALLGVSEGGPMSVLFAATYPERVRSLVLYGTFPTAKAGQYSSELAELIGSPERAAEFEGEVKRRFSELTTIVEEHWGEGRAIEWFAPNLAGSPSLRRV